MRQFKVKKCKRIHGLVFSPDGDRLLVRGGYEASGPDTAIRVDLATGEPDYSFSALANVFAVAADRSRIAIGEDAYSRSAMSKVVRWFDPWEEKSVWENVNIGARWPSRTGAIAVSALAFSVDASRLMASFGWQSFDRNEPSWTFHLAECSLKSSTRPVVANIDSQVTFLSAAPDRAQWTGNSAIERRFEIHLFDRPGNDASARSASSQHPFGRLTFSPDGRLLAATQAREVLVLKSDLSGTVGTLYGQKGQLNALAFSPDSRRLLTASHDGAIRVWDTGSCQLVTAFDWKIGPVTAVAYAPDGLTAVAGGSNGRMVVWDSDE